jgi:GT2 family glycosyltransferase
MRNDDLSVFIIIPVHNRRATTLRCLEHLRGAGDLPRRQVIVVDDGSTDGTGDAVRAAFPEATVLSGDGNLWWTGAINVGMKQAMDRNADILIWMNDDVLPEKGALDALVDFLLANPRTIAGAACRSATSGRLVETGFHGRRRLSAQPGEVVPVDGISGYCVAIPSSVVKEIGYPDAVRFPHYIADSAYVMRARAAGFSAVLLGQAVATIEGGGHDTTQGFAAYCRHLGRPSFRRTFLVWKSPYHWRTQVNYHILKYGAGAGWSLSALKFLVRLAQWGLIRLRRAPVA